MDNNETPISIFIDLSKAFDTLNHKILLDKLIHYTAIRKLFKVVLRLRMTYLGHLRAIAPTGMIN